MPPSSEPPTPPRICVIDKDHNILGTTPARIGLRTYYGPITRFTDKTIWVQSRSGIESRHRVFDGRLPSVYKSRVAAKDVDWYTPKS